MNYSKGQPFATMLIAQISHLETVLAQKDTCSEIEIQAAYFDALKRERSKHIEFMDRIKTLQGKKNGNEAFIQIQRIAKQGKPYYGKSERTKKTARALDSLERSVYIYEKEPKEWLIQDPLFGVYCRNLEAV